MPSTDKHNDLDPRAQQTLLQTARESIEYGFAHLAPLPVDPDRYEPQLGVPRATFVTLTRNGQLRGCIGTLEARRPLVEDVAHNAFAAAFHDPRFPRLKRQEWPAIQLSLSICSPPEPIPADSEAELLARLRPGIDGLTLEDDARRATFLPSVWNDLPDPADFLQHLKRKAGWPVHYWAPTLRAYRYTTQVFH
jgi:uncharacterized protein